MPSSADVASIDVWERHAMAIDDITRRLQAITAALNDSCLEYAFVGGQAVAMWVATVDPAAVRTTKDIDVLVRREDLPAIRQAGLAAGMDYFEVMGVGMLLDRANPNPRHAVHLVWAGEKVRPGNPHAAPTIDQHERLPGGRPVVSLAALVRMKLVSDRDQDRVHIRDLIDVGLVTRDLLDQVPADLRNQLDRLLLEQGR